MSAIIIVGAQWGDEGKGKATDILGGKVDYVVKPNGGNNAGHTVVVGGEKYELKLLPAGVLSENATPILGNGVVINLEALFDEIDGLEARGADASRLRISGNAHLVAPYHQTLDRVQERFLGKRAIGTTGRGIGPTYADKVARVGLRVQDILDESILRQKIESALDVKNQMLVKMYNRRAIEADAMMDYFMSYAERLKPMIIDAENVLNTGLTEGKHVLMEGGQATMLDVDHGTYPFVTSSNPTAGGACVGSGIGPTKITATLGIVKAYTTRVGAGPFPTELFDKWGEYLQETGGEVGVNTGRKRRCGWYDAVVVKYAAQINGLTDLAITKLDVLNPDLCRLRRRRRPPRRNAADPVRLPPRHPHLRNDAGLGRRHHRLHHLRRTPAEGPGLRSSPRGTLRRADQLHRCRPRPRPDHRPLRRDGPLATF